MLILVLHQQWLHVKLWQRRMRQQGSYRLQRHRPWRLLGRPAHPQLLRRSQRLILSRYIPCSLQLQYYQRLCSRGNGSSSRRSTYFHDCGSECHNHCRNMGTRSYVAQSHISVQRTRQTPLMQTRWKQLLP